MSLGFLLATLAEITVGLFLIWGFWHEDKMVELEDKLFAHLGIHRRPRHTAKITPFSKNGSHKKHCI